MKKNEVPQDKSALFGSFHEIQYAVNNEGRYIKEKSSGWVPKTVANSQFWKTVQESVLRTMEQVRQGRLSSLAYYMEIRQMDVGLLAEYVGLARWRVKRHLKPKVFARLKPDMLQRYARVLKVNADDLKRLPENAEHPACVEPWAEIAE